VFGDFDGTTASHPVNITPYALVPSIPTCEDIFVTMSNLFEIGFRGGSNVIDRPTTEFAITFQLPSRDCSGHWHFP
jgi:hypothetical protein